MAHEDRDMSEIKVTRKPPRPPEIPESVETAIKTPTTPRGSPARDSQTEGDGRKLTQAEMDAINSNSNREDRWTPADDAKHEAATPKAAETPKKSGGIAQYKDLNTPYAKAVSGRSAPPTAEELKKWGVSQRVFDADRAAYMKAFPPETVAPTPAAPKTAAKDGMKTETYTLPTMSEEDIAALAPDTAVQARNMQAEGPRTETRQVADTPELMRAKDQHGERFNPETGQWEIITDEQRALDEAAGAPPLSDYDATTAQLSEIRQQINALQEQYDRIWKERQANGPSMTKIGRFVDPDDRRF